MELSKKQKILVGLGTFWPLLYIPIFIAFMIALFAGSAMQPGNGPELDPIFGIGFGLFFLVHMFTIFLSLGMTVFHVIHAVKNQRLESNMRIVWIVLFFFVGIIAEPIYFYLEVWKDKPVATSPGQLPPPPATVDYEQDFASKTYVSPIDQHNWR